MLYIGIKLYFVLVVFFVIVYLTRYVEPLVKSAYPLAVFAMFLYEDVDEFENAPPAFNVLTLTHVFPLFFCKIPWTVTEKLLVFGGTFMLNLRLTFAS